MTQMSSTMKPPEAKSESSLSNKLRAFVSRSGLLLALIILFAILTFIAPNFLSTRNMLNVLRQVSFTGIIACGMTMALVAADVDLSVGSVVALSSALLAVLYAKAHWPLWAAAIFVVIEATIVGLLGGYIRVRWNIPALIVTLALMTSLRGVAFVLTNAFPIPISDPAFEFWGGGYVLGIPVPVIIFLLIVFVFWFMSTRTVYGRSIYAVGGNSEAARLSGIPVKLIRMSILGMTACLASISGILLTSRLTSGYAGVGVGWEFDAISAALIGGTSLFGGEGSITGTLLGVLFIGLLANGMVLLGINPYLQDVVRGFIILLAVLLSALQRPKAS
jgi:ribose/xylose/arabinose/galactoside ABC-type transport system permease subunit